MRSVLGVDPGSLQAGWGLVAGDPGRPSLVDCGVIRLPQGFSFPARLHRLACEMQALLERIQPEAAAVESPFHGVNPRSALQLAHARGVILAAVHGAGVPLTEYAPAAVKRSVTGNGRAEKEQVQQMVVRLLRIPGGVPPEPDAADALAVALCHLACASSPLAGRRG